MPIQEGYRVTPLALWGKPEQPAKGETDPTVDMKTPPKLQVDGMKPDAFFRYAAELLKTNPPHQTDWSQVERLRRIGIVRGEAFDLSLQDPAIRSAIEQGAADALKLMIEKANSLDRVANGWQIATDTVGVYGYYYLKRAIVARRGLGVDFLKLGDLADNVRIKRGGPFMHLKAYAIDGELRTGSANFSASGEHEQDNDLVVIRDAGAAGKFDAHFERMWDAAEPMIEFAPAINALEPK